MEDIRGTLYVIMAVLAMKIVNSSSLQFLNIECQDQNLLSNSKFKKSEDPNWYLSSNGSDTSTCGPNVSNACRTLDWLLDRFYKTSYKMNHTLTLYTDTSLNINYKLVEKYPWIRILTVSVSNIQNIRHVHVYFNNVTLFKTTWSINDMSLTLKFAHLRNAKLFLQRSNNSTISNHCNITNSTFGLLKVSRAFNILVSNSDLTGTTSFKDTLIDITDSELDIVNSTFEGCRVTSYSAVLQAKSSKINIRNSVFRENSGQNGVIEISRGSNLNINNTTFKNNGFLFSAVSTILVKTNSSAKVSNCKFTKNIAVYGGVLSSFPNSSIVVENSTFIQNTGQRGGAINCHNQQNLTATKNKHSPLLVKARKVGQYFSAKELKEAETLERNIMNSFLKQSEDDTKCIVKESNFINNWAAESGGAIYVQGRSIDILDCTFTNNTGGFGGVIMGYEKSRINIEGTHFINNAGMLGNVINIRINVALNMDNCFFNYNDTDYVSGPFIRARDYSYLSINRCYFISQAGIPYIFDAENFTDIKASNSNMETYRNLGSSVLFALNNVRAKFVNCSFYKHGGFQAIQNSFITIEDSTYTQAHHVTPGALFFVQHGSHLYISNTNISEVKTVYNPLYFITSDDHSFVAMKNCLYTNNNLVYHFIATGNSLLVIDQSEFVNNKGVSSRGFSALFYVTDNDISVSGSVFRDNIISARLIKFYLESFLFEVLDSNVNFTDSSFFNNSVQTITVTVSKVGTQSKYLQISKCTFDNEASPFQAQNLADINIQNSHFKVGKGFDTFPGYIDIIKPLTVRIAASSFISSNASLTQIHFEQYGSSAQEFSLLTMGSTFSDGIHTVPSDSEDFMKRVKSLKFLKVDYKVTVQQRETEYASILPVPCKGPFGTTCECYFYLEENANIYNCSHLSIGELPTSVPIDTHWLVMDYDQVSQLSSPYAYFDKIWFLNLRENAVDFINDDFLGGLKTMQQLRWLDLRNNNLQMIPTEIQELTFLERVWLKGNPIHCDCRLLWMIGWLNNFTLPNGKHVVVDYTDIKCSTGKMKGIPLFVLDEVTMGCFPSKWLLWQKVVVGVGASVGLVIIVVLMVVTIRKSRDIQFFLYYYCKWCTCFGVPRDDRNENLENMEYDAFLSYSNKDTRWVSEVFRRNKWKDGSRLFDLEKDDGFRLLVPQRDFIIGDAIADRIAVGMDKSRRVIFIVSRNFLRSKRRMWGLKLADTQALKRKRKYTVIIFKEKLTLAELTPELRTYKKLGLCIQFDENIDRMAAKIRFNMPQIPLADLRPQQFPRLGDEENEFDSDNEDTDEPEEQTEETEGAMAPGAEGAVAPGAEGAVAPSAAYEAERLGDNEVTDEREDEPLIP